MAIGASLGHFEAFSTKAENCGQQSGAAVPAKNSERSETQCHDAWKVRLQR